MTGGFFAVTGQKLLEGRTFAADDLDSRQPVAIVNAAFAQKHFGTESALGRRFRTAGRATRSSPVRGGRSSAWSRTVRMLGPFNTPGVDETGFYVPFFSNPVGPIQRRRSPASSRRSC